MGIKTKGEPALCPICKKELDGRITHAQAAGETKATWVHVKCLGGKHG